MTEVTLEMSGPLCGVLQGLVTRSPSDGLAILLGARLKSEAREQTDQGSQEVDRLRMVVKDFVMVEVADVLDSKGSIREENIKDIVEKRYQDTVEDDREPVKVLGFLKFRKEWDLQWGLEPSYQDTRLIKALQTRTTLKVFHLVAEGRDTTSAPGIEVLRMTSVTLVVGGGRQPARTRIPLTVPNLQGNSCDVRGISGYKVYSTGSSSLAPLLEAAGLLEEPEHLSQITDSCINLNRLLGKRLEERGAVVLQLEQEAETLELEVAVLEEELEKRLKQSVEYLRLLALQGGLLGALQQVLEDTNTCSEDISEGEEEAKVQASMQVSSPALDPTVRKREAGPLLAQEDVITFRNDRERSRGQDISEAETEGEEEAVVEDSDVEMLLATSEEDEGTIDG